MDLQAPGPETPATDEPMASDPVFPEDDAPGPGLTARPGVDPTLWVAGAFTALGWLPAAWTGAASPAGSPLAGGYFGPLAIPALLAMVGLLFAVIAVLRGIDLGDARQRGFGFAVGAVAFVRLFAVPLVG